MRAIGMVVGFALLYGTTTLASAQTMRSQERLPRWSVQEEWRTRDGEASQPEVSGVGAVTVTRSGSLFAIQNIDRKVISIDDRGRLISSFSRRGDGPGEFQRPIQLGLLGDSLWVLDNVLRRVTVLAPGATEPATRRWADILPQLGTDVRGVVPLLRPTGLLANGRLVLENALTSLPSPVRAVGRADSTYLMLLDTHTRRIDTLDLIERRQPLLEVEILGAGQTRGMLSPFATNDLVSQDPYGRLLVAVRNRSPFPDSSRFLVTAWTPDGRRAFQRQLPFTPPVLTEEEIQAYLDQVRRSIQPSTAGAPVRLRVKEGPKAGEPLPPVTGLVIGTN